MDQLVFSNLQNKSSMFVEMISDFLDADADPDKPRIPLILRILIKTKKKFMTIKRSGNLPLRKITKEAELARELLPGARIDLE